MRRPPVACQRAVQSLQSPAPQHFWVPDEVLSLAVRRFFHDVCPQQKRHGSNVPGPLEARRRAAKRRMTVSAGYSPQDSFPTSFSLGALFGLRSDPQTSWKYEPPSLSKNGPGLGTLSSAWEDAPSRPEQPQGTTIDTTPADYDPRQSLAQQPGGIVDQHGGRNPFGTNASNLEIDRTLVSCGELEQSLDAFKAGFTAAGCNLSIPALKVLFKENLPFADSAWKYYTAVLDHLHLAGWNPKPVLRCLLEEDGQLLRMRDPIQSPTECAAFMDSLDTVAGTKIKERKPLINRILKVMAQSAADARRSTTELQDEVLLRLIERNNHVSDTSLKTLHGLASNLSDSAQNKFLLAHIDEWNRVKEAIISTVRNVAAAPGGFAGAKRALFYMPRSQLFDAIPTITIHLTKSTLGRHSDKERINPCGMETWLRLLHQIDLEDGVGKKLLDVALTSLASTLSIHEGRISLLGSPKHFVRAALLHQGLDIQISYADEALPRIQNVLTDALLQLQARPEAYASLLDLALPLVARHAGLTVLLRCIRAMEEKNLPLSTNIEFEPLIARELAELQTPTASLSNAQLQNRAFALQACDKLIKALIRAGYALPVVKAEAAELSQTHTFDNILAHARANHALPIACRGTTTELAVMERVVLIHQLAHHYSQDTSRTQRAAWRSVYYLYKYLRSNHLPLGPLFTQAIVHVSITRPLLENRFVSARRLIWVWHVVARVEGDGVAARLQSTFFERRGLVMGHAKQTYVGVGGNALNKAHIGSMKRIGLI